MKASKLVRPHRNSSRIIDPSATIRLPKIVPDLDGVSETMLWTLYDRAYDASCPDSVLFDRYSVRVFSSLDYDFAGRFGQPTGAFSARAAGFDRLIRAWLQRHPDGLVVSLGEGLETQACRVDNGLMRWLTVELAPAIALRNKLIPHCPRFHHIVSNVNDPRWTDGIEPDAVVLVIAQGLLMYLDPTSVKRLIIQLVERFPGGEIIFDIVPRWFSQLSLYGFIRMPRYQLPPMPWGIDSDEVEPQLRAWTPLIASVRMFQYHVPRGWPKVAEELFRLYPLASRHLPAIVLVETNGPRPIFGHFSL